MLPPNLHLLSSGAAASALQKLPGKIATSAAELGIVPTLTLNNVPYFAEDDVQRIGDHLRSADPLDAQVRATGLR